MSFWAKLESMKNNGKPFYVYGQTLAPQLKTVLDVCNINVVGVIDDDPCLIGKTSQLCTHMNAVRGGGIVSLNTLVQSGIDNNYIIGIGYGQTLTKKLVEAGVDKNNILWLNYGKIGFQDVFNSPTYVLEHYEKYKENLFLFEDEKSKRQYLEMINFRLDFNGERLQAIDINAFNQYFDDVIPFSEDEVYVDAGAFNGKTIENFINHVHGQYKRIYAVEASDKNVALLRERLKNYENINLLEFALCEKTCKLHFDNDMGANSKINMQGNVEVNGDKLDNLITEKVTYIKMDIEGAERRALQGCQRIIKEDRPKLAICIYHSAEDMLELPQIIANMCPNYKFFFRQHGEDMYESVFYAVPIENIK